MKIETILEKLGIVFKAIFRVFFWLVKLIVSLIFGIIKLIFFLLFMWHWFWTKLSLPFIPIVFILMFVDNETHVFYKSVFFTVLIMMVANFIISSLIYTFITSNTSLKEIILSIKLERCRRQCLELELKKLKKYNSEYDFLDLD